MAGWPAGYPSRGAWVFYDVTQDFAFWPRLSSVSISQSHPDGIATLECEVVDTGASLTFADEDEAYVTFDGTRIWAGRLRVLGQAQETEHGPRVYRLTGQDYTALLDDDIIGTDTERPRELVSARVTWILSKLDYGITTNGVSLPSEYVDPASFEGTTIREALERTADELSLHFYLDFDEDLHMFRTETVAAPFSLNDTSPNYSTSFPYSEWDLNRDSLELTNVVRVKGKRHVRDVRDYPSIAAYGIQRSIIVDDSLRTVAQVIAAGNRRLNQLAEPIIDGSLVCWEPGLQAGMTVTIVNDLWGISGTYIINGISISADDPHDASGDARLRTEVSFTDKRRVGRFPGGKGGGRGGGEKERIRKAINKLNRVPFDNLGGCCTPVPISQNDLNEFGGSVAEGPVSVGSDASGVDHVYSEGDTTATIPIPDGAKVGRSIIAVVADAGSENLQDEMEAAGWSQMLAASNTPFWYRRIDGTEGYDGTDDTEGIFVSGVSVSLASVVDLLDAVYDEGPDNPGPWYVVAYSNTTDPDDVPAPGSWNGEPAITYVAVITDGSAVTAGPAGYTLLAEDASQAGSGILISVWYKIMPSGAAAEDPGSVTTADSTPFITTVMVRGGTIGPFGYIVPGPTWIGGNPFDPNGIGAEPAWEVTDGDLVITAGSPDLILDYIATAPPDMPTQLADWQFTIPFTIDTVGSGSDDGERYIAIHVVRDGYEFIYTAHLGDTGTAAGVSVGDAEDYAAVSVPADTAMSFKVGFDGTNATAKLWQTASAEPAWQVTYAEAAWATTTEEDSLRIVVSWGDESGDTGMVISPFVIEGGAQPGDAVDWEIVGYGDGSTTQFTTTYPYVQNTLQVRVDQQVLNSGVTETTPGSGVFTLSQAPYGDPTEGNGGSSVVEARYTRS